MATTGPLAGLLVVDFTRIVSGPFASQILGDMGADVVKIERVDGGEEGRAYGVTEPGLAPGGATFLAMNRNKRSVTLNVQTPDGREAARRLLRTADVALHNFRTGVMERLGLGYDEISRENPRIVYCSISGWGSVGPLAESAANDLSVQAFSGLLGITGEPDGPPVRVPTPVCDMTAGLYATIGILSALMNRQTTGRGQAVETNMLEGQLNMLNYFFVDYWLTGRVPQRMGTANRMGLPNQAFPTADGWVCVTAPHERAWVKCCEALDVAPLAVDPRFATLADRYEHRDELAEAVGSATGRFTTAECMRRLTAAGVPCAPVNTLPQVAVDPQLDALGSVVEMDVSRIGPLKLIMSPLHFSETPLSARRPPPEAGQHNDEVLARLGYSAADIARMRANGSVG